MTTDVSSASSLEWEQRFEAVARLYREAHEKLETDPLSAALRARQAIEHIADYLHTRELGPAARNEMLDAKLKRIDAKLVFPRLVATHFGSVQIHTNSVIHPGTMASDPDPNLLRPCMLSLQIVVEWFFREYLKRPAPALQNAPARATVQTPPTVPDATPVNSTISTMLNQGTRLGTGIGEFIPIWRSSRTAHTLRLESETDSEQKVFKLEGASTYTIGRGEQRSDGSRNDFAVPKTWNSISRDQGTITVTTDGDVVLANTSSNNNFFVRGEQVPKGASRALRHGDNIQLGRCVGTYSDGRYYASAPTSAVDTRTGLLSRAGLVAEIAGILAIGKPHTLFVLRCPDADARDPERMSAMLAMELHRAMPSAPVGRIEMVVALILPSSASTAELANLARARLGTACTSGFMTLAGTADQALPRLEACLGALSRVAIAGREPAAPEDLTRYALTPTPIDDFAAKGRALFELGGGAVLFVVDEMGRIPQLAPQALPVLELELVEMLGARMGPRDIVSFAAPGLILFGTSGDVDRFATELGVAWHARGPVTANAVEIDRSLAAHLLTVSDLADVAKRAHDLASGGNAALGASGLPAPIALAARAIDEARTPAERARALVHAAEVAWQMLAFILLAAGRGATRAAAAASEPASTWPAPWRQLARDAARRIESEVSRVAELAAVVAAADRDATARAAIDELEQLATSADVERQLPRLERAVRELFGRLAPLRGWTLIGIESSEVVDLEGLAQRVEYVDYTGPTPRGSHQRITVMGFRGFGRFVYLVRWNEGLAIALEPFIRRADLELCLARGPITEPGTHQYRSLLDGRTIDLPVTAKQIGPTR